MENNNNKVNIKALLEQNNIKVNNNEIETDFTKSITNVIDEDSLSQVENAGEEKGVEVNHEDYLSQAGIRGGGVPGNIITAEQMASIEETLKELEIETELAKKEFEEFQKKQEEEERKRKEAEALEPLSYDDDDPDSFSVEEPKNVVQEDDSMDDGTEKSEDFLKRYNEAVVVIDKTGMGQVINFTDEEREKMKKVKSIKLKEVETIELKSIKTKKAKTGIADRILQKRNTIKNTTIVLPISGLTMVMRGCSTFELMGLINGDQVNVQTLISKWTLIHSKVETTSIGKMDFNAFLNNVASLEYDILVYGILCATFPDEDTFPLTCPLCKSSIEHKYEMRSLLRAEEMSDKLIDMIKHVADNSYTENSAKECFESSVLNTEKSIQLPDSEFICTIGVQNAYSFIYDSVNAIDRMDEKYNQATIISSAVSKIFVPNPDDGGETYLEIDDTEDKIKLIYSLNAKDISILSTKIGEITEGLEFKFGLMDITCPNMKCRHHVNSVEVELDTILFHKYQQAMNTTID
jgi:hypothetical protein